MQLPWRPAIAIIVCHSFRSLPVVVKPEGSRVKHSRDHF